MRNSGCPLYVIALACALSALPLPGHAGGTLAAPATHVAPAAPDAIRSDAAFAAWVTSDSETFRHMTPGARKRVVQDIRFRNGALVSLGTDDLAAELTTAEIADVLARLGMSATLEGLTGDEAARRRARAPVPVDAGGIEDRFDRFRARLRNPANSPLDAYRDAFPEHLWSNDLASATPHELDLLLRAIALTQLDGPDRSWSARAEAAHARLARTGDATRAHTQNVEQLLIVTGRLDHARAFAERHRAQGLVPLPPIVDVSDGATHTALVRNGDSIERRPVDTTGLRIVAVIGTGCSKSQQAAVDIPGDALLGPIARDRGIWITETSAIATIDRVDRWNVDFPSAPLVIADDTAAWSVPQWNSVPQFHVMRDGVLVETVDGWPPEGQRDALLAAWVRAGGEARLP